MGLYPGGLIIGRKFASKILGIYFPEGFFGGDGGGGGGGLIIGNLRSLYSLN